MEDLQFQLNMVRSLNQQLNGKEKMYQLVCSTFHIYTNYRVRVPAKRLLQEFLKDFAWENNFF